MKKLTKTFCAESSADSFFTDTMKSEPVYVVVDMNRLAMEGAFLISRDAYEHAEELENHYNRPYRVIRTDLYS